MGDRKQLVHAAAYEPTEAVLADVDAIERLHKDEMIGQHRAAVIDKLNGEPHVVMRMDRPHIRAVAECLGGGTLLHKQLHEAAGQLGAPEQLAANRAGLIAVGGPTIGTRLDKALGRATKVVKRTVEATPDELASEPHEAVQS